ncbi:MAG: DISARM system helicase DrmA [Planctomycetota bacterium]|nr:DISARM system helicase DrmA [Planctomycetota bacterium]
MNDAAAVRSRILNALRLDLVGPRPGEPDHDAYAEEVLPLAPSNWYLTGFLVPYEASPQQRSDDDGDDTIDEVNRPVQGDDDNAPEATSARKAFFPSSMGLSVLVPKDVAELDVRIAWADYVPMVDEGVEENEPAPSGNKPKGKGSESGAGPDRGSRPKGWRRQLRAAKVTVALREGEPMPAEVPGGEGLELVVSLRPVGDTDLVPAGTRSASIFLVNRRKPAPDMTRDAAYVFQAELSLHAPQPFVARPNLRGHESTDWDEKVADLQYADAVEYAVGHNISAVAVTDEENRCQEVRTTWMPTADVEKVVPAQLNEVQLEIEALAGAESADAVRAMVGPMVESYRAWIKVQLRGLPGDAKRAQVGRDLMARAGRARDRIQAGLNTLDQPHVLEAFRIANKAIATAIRQRSCHGKPGASPADLDPPAWYPFQLAFLLTNMAGVVDGEHVDRKVVDLLFFPTGGGKTEAYLGLAAFTMVLRRLRDPSIHSAGLSVIMRYTLRLLTLDQLGRAATLICALELDRQDDVPKLGAWPFEIGLWVGQSATPNVMGKKGDKNRYSARARTIAFLNDDRRKPSPIPLENCPWCGTKFQKQSFTLLPDGNEPTDLRVMCVSRRCAFHGRRQDRGLPILAVDDPIYRRLPAFIIATVDKFANLPWVGETAGLFGRVERYDSEGFYGPTRAGVGRTLEQRLPPPDLIIQDELHLISGPLGTMVGLYETAIDALCADPVGGEGVRPKIIASTATVRRAERQIRAIFGRANVDIFPPPGPDRRDSFFARTVSPAERNARTYVGIAAQGRNLKVMLLRTYLALLSAGQKVWQESGGAENTHNPADPYMTLLGYFNSLRELGGSRRIVEDEVRARLVDYGLRRRRRDMEQLLFANRGEFVEPQELTSRVSTNEVADTKRRLALAFHDKERVDVALASNMISVGLDITRLGLMVVLGQPKTAAEYIQATSRVGRDDERPGLVVTLLNVHRPRDRSHYERFEAWHESFYRAVEATSVTPFSPRAIDRGIAGITLALARLGHPELTAPRRAAAITKYRNELDFVLDAISRRAEGHDGGLTGKEQEELRQKLRGRVQDLLDTWESIAARKGELQYQREVGVAPPLLFSPLDPDLDRQPKEARKFKVPRSLRDVEPTVNLWLRNPDGLEVEGGSHE